jgi:hypothetical protein
MSYYYDERPGSTMALEKAGVPDVFWTAIKYLFK